MKLEWSTSQAYPGGTQRCLDAVLKNPPCGCEQHFTRTVLWDWDIEPHIDYLREHMFEHLKHHGEALEVCPWKPNP